MSNFKKITETENKMVIQEGGEEGKKKSECAYREKCNFEKGRNGRYNENQMYCARVIKAVLVIVNIFVYLIFILMNLLQKYNPLQVIIIYYSLWGATIAMVSHIFSIIACNHEGWFKLAYISTEISYAVNTLILIVFWLILWPMIVSQASSLPDEVGTFIKWYQGLLHAVPWITTVSDLYMTDMALEKKHWWITFVTMFPCYMVCNWWGSMNIGYMSDPSIKGKIYGPEQWDTNVPFTMFCFLCLAAFQSAIFYLTALLMDKIWPKREEENFDFKNHLLDSEAPNQIN